MLTFRDDDTMSRFPPSTAIPHAPHNGQQAIIAWRNRIRKDESDERREHLRGQAGRRRSPADKGATLPDQGLGFTYAALRSATLMIALPCYAFWELITLGSHFGTPAEPLPFMP